MSSYETLSAKIAEHSARVGVIGMGYVGLPLAVRAARVGFPVLGFDVSADKVATLNRGESYIGDVATEDLAGLTGKGRLRATTDMAELGSCDIVVICVPTPLNTTRDPDISYIAQASSAIADSVRDGQLVILESTTYPGTTEEIVRPRIETSELKVGEQLFLAFSPERIDPGQVSSAGFSVENTPKVVGGVTPRCGELASSFYAQVTNKVVTVSSPRIAELTKLFENIFRAVNIALVNELALLCDRMNLSVWEVIEAAATKPFGFMKFQPGPGLGGHCIPIDPFYLTWKAREFDFTTRFIELAGEINTRMPHHVRELVLRALNAQGRSLRGARVALLGVAYKKDVNDYRESPVFKVMDLLAADGVQFIACDPHIDTFEAHDGRRFATTPLTDELLGSLDCAVIITDHSAFDYEKIVERVPVVVDTRNATKGVKQHRDHIILL